MIIYLGLGSSDHASLSLAINLMKTDLIVKTAHHGFWMIEIEMDLKHI